MQVFELHTGLGPGAGKAIDPEKIFEGSVFDTVQGGANGRLACRQIVVSAPKERDVYKIEVLAYRRVGDILGVGIVRAGEVENRYQIKLPTRGGRLVRAEDSAVMWQSPQGCLFLGEP